MPGYQLDRFERQDIPEECICLQCKNVLKDPIGCKICRKFYCKVCQEQSLDAKVSACMHGKFSHEINKYLLDKINKLLARCRYKKCEYFDIIQNVDKHEEICQFAVFKCDNPDCKFLLDKTSRKSHALQCEFNTVYCQKGCNKKMRQKDIKSHNCVQWLNEVLENTSCRNKTLISENQELHQQIEDHQNQVQQEKDKYEKLKETFRIEKQQLQMNYEEMKHKYEKEVAQRDEKIAVRFNEYQKIQEVKIKQFMQKCDQDYLKFNQKIQEFLNNFLLQAKKTLIEYNQKVKADTLDLVNVPQDLKTLDASPIKTLAGKIASLNQSRLNTSRLSNQGNISGLFNFNRQRTKSLQQNRRISQVNCNIELFQNNFLQLENIQEN